MDFGQAIEFGWDGTGGVKLFVFLGTEASCLLDVLEEIDEFVFELWGRVFVEDFVSVGVI